MTVVKLRWRKLKSGVRSYYLDYHINGNRTREFLKLHLRYGNSEDRETLLKLAKEAQRIKTVQLTSNDRDLDLDLEKELSFIDHFKKYIEEYQGKDIRKLNACLKHFKDYLETQGRDDIKRSLLKENVKRDFKGYLGSRVGSETLSSYMGVLNKVIRGEHFAPRKIEEDTLAKNILTDAEIAKLAKVECGNEQVKRAFLLACYTGFGLAECKSLSWDHIYDGQINMRRNKTSVALGIPMTNTTLSLLGTRDKSKKVFSSLPTSNGANKTIKNWVARAEIDKHITFYCARHSFCVRLLNQGVDLITLSQLMGHSGTRNLTKYLRYSDGPKRRAIESLPDLKL